MARKRRQVLLAKLRKKAKAFRSKYGNSRRSTAKFFNKRHKKLGRRKWRRFALFDFVKYKKNPLLGNSNLRRSLFRMVRRSAGASLLRLSARKHTTGYLRAASAVKYKLAQTRYTIAAEPTEQQDVVLRRWGRKFEGSEKTRKGSFYRNKIALVSALYSNLPSVIKSAVVSNPPQNKMQALPLLRLKKEVFLSPRGVGTGRILNLQNKHRLLRAGVRSILGASQATAVRASRVRKVSKSKVILPVLCKIKGPKHRGVGPAAQQSSLVGAQRAVLTAPRQQLAGRSAKIQKNKNRALRVRRYIHLNYLTKITEFALNRRKVFEGFRVWRIHSRF